MHALKNSSIKLSLDLSFIDEFFKACTGQVRTYQNILPYPDDQYKLQIDKLRKLVDYYVGR